jgi:hypothetical protein
MKTYKPLLGFVLLMALIFSCQKEKSFEIGNVAASTGSLKSGTTGDCLGSLVSGIYKKDTVLGSANYVDVQVDISKTGSYVISSDTINGFYFAATGVFTTVGLDTVRLQGSGTPVAAGTNVFTVTYDSSQCTFTVPVIDGGSGGTSSFTLAGAPNDCTGASVQGIYTASVAANSSNTATIQVNVATVGTYAISTTEVDGITFSASGNFSATGSQQITLSANGTPATAGTFQIPITAGSSNCSFQLIVVTGTPAVYDLSGAPDTCTGAAVDGSYAVGTELTPSNTATIQVNVTTPGVYSITTTATNGITFTGSGVFSSTGVQSVVLIGHGTPTTAGSFDIPITVGSSSCSFSIEVGSSDYFPRTANSNWSYEFDNNSSDTLYQEAISPTLSALGNTYNIFMGDAGSVTDTLGYFRKSSNDYYQYLDVGEFFSLDNSSWGEYIFLKDNVSEGTSWESDPFTNTFTDSTGAHPVSVRFKETIQQKDASITVQGTTYQNTIVVKEEYEYSFDNNTWDTFPLYTVNYFSLGVGLIKVEFTDNSGSGGSYIQELTRYQVF